MHPHRRRVVTVFAASAAALTAWAKSAAAAPSRRPQDAAAESGLRPGSPEDQSRVLQSVLDECARTRTPLVLPAGVYRASNLKLSAGTQVFGTRGSTTIMLSQAGASLISASGSDHLTLSGLIFDGGHKPLPDRRGLAQLENCKNLKIADCAFQASAGSALVAIGSGGEFINSSFINNADVAIHVFDSSGFLIARNRIAGAGNGGIQVWRSHPGDDGTMVIDNVIERIENRLGGSGQYGNAINVFRAGNVSVRGNRIRDCAFSAVRGNAASNLHIEGNSISNAREVAIYAEFAFEGALIASNTIDGAAIGISVTNFNDGGRLAVVQGNLIRNLLPRRPVGTDARDGAGIGIAVEADTTVNGNVIENAPTVGIMLGSGAYLRDVAATGNVVRKSAVGIGVSVAPGAGTALIANNLISEALAGAIVGMRESTPVTGDLAKAGSEQYANVMVTGNRVR
jgi:uncharacterized secreted repeat protein (TIGR03808 family)